MKIISKRDTTTIYEDKGVIIKSFSSSYPKEKIYSEYDNSPLMYYCISHNSPRAHLVTTYKDNLSIIFDKIGGSMLIDALLTAKTPSLIINKMAKLHQKILKNKLREEVISFKTRLYQRTSNPEVKK